MAIIKVRVAVPGRNYVDYIARAARDQQAN